MRGLEILPGGGRRTEMLGESVGGALLWVAMGIAMLFVGYLLYDSYRVWRRRRRMSAWSERSRRQVAEEEAEARLASHKE